MSVNLRQISSRAVNTSSAGRVQGWLKLKTAWNATPHLGEHFHGLTGSVQVAFAGFQTIT